MTERLVPADAVLVASGPGAGAKDEEKEKDPRKNGRRRQKPLARPNPARRR